MVLGRSTGMTIFSRTGVRPYTTVYPTGPADVFVLFYHPTPIMPDKISGATNTSGWRTTPTLHLSPAGTPAGTEYFTAGKNPNSQGSATLQTSDTVTNDYYGFDDDIGYNSGYGIGLDYSAPPYPEYMTVTIGALGASKGTTMDTNAVYLEDNSDVASGDESWPVFDLTCRDTTKYVRYAPNRPASARLAKKLLCGNINRVTQYNRQALCTALDE